MSAPVEVLLALIGAAVGSVGTKLVDWFSRRRREAALTKRITVEANDIVFESYRDLITDLRRDAELARTEARDARHEARDAMARAAEAESVAARAVETAGRAALALTEVRRLVAEQVPDNADLLRQIERIAAHGRV